MKIPRLLAGVAIACTVLLLGAPSFAHHSFAAEFDGDNCREFTGILTKLDWQSPHAYFYMDVKDASGKVESWSFQTYALITLRRSGTDRQVFLDNIGRGLGSRVSGQEWAGALCRRRDDEDVGWRVAAGRATAGLAKEQLP